MSVATFLRESKIVGTEGNMLIIGFAKNLALHKEMLEQENNRRIIESNLSELLKQRVVLKCVFTEKSPEDTSVVEDSFSSDVLDEIVDAFGGEVIE